MCGPVLVTACPSAAGEPLQTGTFTNTMKYLLSLACYHLGDLWCRLVIFPFGTGYPVYRWLMIASCDLDEHQRIWKDPDENQDH